MVDGPTGDVSLDLGLVDPVDTDPDERPTDGHGPERVSFQRVWVKADRRVTFYQKVKKDIFNKCISLY